MSRSHVEKVARIIHDTLDAHFRPDDVQPRRTPFEKAPPFHKAAMRECARDVLKALSGLEPPASAGKGAP